MVKNPAYVVGLAALTTLILLGAFVVLAVGRPAGSAAAAPPAFAWQGAPPAAPASKAITPVRVKIYASTPEQKRWLVANFDIDEAVFDGYLMGTLTPDH